MRLRCLSLEDRIFIEKELRAGKIRESWMQLGDFDIKKLGPQWKELHDALVRMAHRDLGITDEPTDK